MQNEIRVKIEEDKQKEIFKKFLKKFDNDFQNASNYLNITKSSLSKYKRGVSRYLPEEVLSKIISHLKIEEPQIIYSGTLKEIRNQYMKKAHPVLEQKYGKSWAKELTNRRDFKGIHLENFPDNIFIYLEDNYRKELFKAFYNLFGSLHKASKILDVSFSRLPFWYYGKQKDYKTNKTNPQLIPLKQLKIIAKALVEDGREEFSMENIEKHTLMYGMRAGSPIKNPKFPIKECSELTRLLFHLLGDGYAGKKGESGNYRNTYQELLEEFKEDLTIFGDIPVYEQKFSIKFPQVLAKIIEEYYKINSRTYESQISTKIFQIPKKNLYLGIRAFADDEGTIYPNSIRISSANYNLLSGIKQILSYLNLKSNEIKSQQNLKARFGKTYYLDIRDIEKYHKNIGSTHPRKKELLYEYVKRKKSRRRKRLLNP